MVERIKTIPTEMLDLNKIKESIERDVALDFDRNRLQCQPDRVKMSVRVSQKSTRILANVPPTVLVDSEDYDARVFPGTVSLTLEGPRALLDTLSSGDVSVLLNLSGKDEARYKLAPEIILPPGVNLAEVSVDSLIVDIFKNTETRP